MLQVIKTVNEIPSYVNFDPYIPIDIEFGSWNISKEPTIYWRTGDFKKSLIEIGIDSSSGKIRSITLTQIKNIYENSKKVVFDETNIIMGLPVFEINNWGENGYLDELKEFDVYVGMDRVCILFSLDKVTSILKNGRVYFGLDKNNNLSMILYRKQ